jgi:CDP-glycerol glycerophosphotransferase
VIIPFNKTRRYLKDCLDSLHEQNLDDVEIILILNGVTEDIDDLLSDDLIVKSFDSEITVSKARNAGLDMANGEYVYFIDSDDYLYEDSLNRLMDVARKTNADFINGERISTYYIREKFEIEVERATLTEKENLSDMQYSLRLLTGIRVVGEEVMSVLHSLIRRDSIGDIRFDESKVYHSDYPFLMDVLDNLNTFYGVENALYAKRTSDDILYEPTLYQSEENRFMNYYNEYKKVLAKIDGSSEEKYILLKKEMANKMFRFYYYRYEFDHDDEMIDISRNFNLLKLSFLQKREIKALQSRNMKKVKRLKGLRVGKKKLKRLLKHRWRFKTLIYFRVYNKRPINERKIFFESFKGNYYTDSPKYIYEYLYEHYPDEYDYVWVINDKNTKIPGNPKRVKKNTLAHYKEMATSKYWVMNTRQDARYFKRNGQIFLSTWHGTPLKRLGFDMENIHLKNPKTKDAYLRDSSDWDYFVSQNPFSTETLARAFGYDGVMLETGYPRNDILYNADEDKVNQIKSDLNIPAGKKVILYAPTWRDIETHKLEDEEYGLELDLNLLKESLGDEYVILIRTHYLISNNLNLDDFGDFAINVSGYDDIAELYLVSDLLITDYSSVFFDFANLRRPVLFYTYDLEEYESELRGFYIDIKTEVPGPLLMTSEEVLEAIQNIDEITEEYREKYDEFYDRFCSIDDGNASKRIVEIVWDKHPQD